MGTTNFDKVLLPRLELDPTVALAEVVGIPHYEAANWMHNEGFDLHPIVDLFIASPTSPTIPNRFD